MHLRSTRRQWKCELEAAVLLGAVVSREYLVVEGGVKWVFISRQCNRTVKQWRYGERLSFPSTVSTGAANPMLRLEVGQASGPF